MRLLRRSHCFVWGSLAALLYAGAANPARDPDASRTDQLAAQADAGLTGADTAAIMTDPDDEPARSESYVTIKVTERDVKPALTEPDVKPARTESDARPALPESDVK